MEAVALGSPLRRRLFLVCALVFPVIVLYLFVWVSRNHLSWNSSKLDLLAIGVATASGVPFFWRVLPRSAGRPMWVVSYVAAILALLFVLAFYFACTTSGDCL